jgi:hypothetical protein
VAFVIKTEVADPHVEVFSFQNQKTMYGGKAIGVGDTIFIFASENEGGKGLLALGLITEAESVAKSPRVERQTPRVNITVRRQRSAKQPLGRAELKVFTEWSDGKPETELNFKLYRQATNKIVGISEGTAAFLQTLF